MPWPSTLFFALLLAFFVGPGFWRRANTGDFFLAGRRAGTGTVAGSLIATCLGASATSGLVARAYIAGWSAVWWLGAGSIGLALLGLVWARFMRESAATRTLPEWAGDTYGLPARTLAAGVIDVMWIAVIAAQWTAAGSILSVMWGWPIQGGIVVAAGCVIGYTIVGGQAAVLRTDRWQLGLLGVAVAAAGFFALRLPGTGTAAPSVSFRLSGIVAVSPLDWLALILVVGGMYVVGPDLCSRVLVAKDTASARRGAFAAALCILPAAFVIVGTGVAIRLSGQVLASPRDALPWLINRSGVVPPWAGAVINAGLLAAMLSSADTCLLTAGSVLELDVLGRGKAPNRQEGRGRLWVAAIGVLSVILACLRPQIIPNMLLAYAFYTGGLLVPLLLLAWPRVARSIPRPVVWWSIVIGGGTPVLLLLTQRSVTTARAGLTGAVVCTLALLAGLVWARAGRRCP
jgi:SSS family solute:Na+ symporter